MSVEVPTMEAPILDLPATSSSEVIVSEWVVGTRERQEAVVETFYRVWGQIPWPAGLLSVKPLLGNDGLAVLNFAEWAANEAYEEFGRTNRKILAAEMDEAVPGIVRIPPTHYQFYRSRLRDNAPEPGCIVMITVEFEGSDPARQRAWVDTVIEALDAEEDLHPGGISGRFYLSTDGKKVLNYAAWASEDAHREAIQNSGQSTVGSHRKWREVRDFPGIRSSSVKRYRLSRTFHAPAG